MEDPSTPKKRRRRSRHRFSQIPSSFSHHARILPRRESEARNALGNTLHDPVAHIPSEALNGLSGQDDQRENGEEVMHARQSREESPVDVFSENDGAQSNPSPSVLPLAMNEESTAGQCIVRPLSALLEESSVKIDNWRVLWALIATNGSRKISKDQYQSVRTIASTFSRLGASFWKLDFNEPELEFMPQRRLSCLPHYKTLHSRYKPIVLHRLAVRGADFQETVDTSRAGARSASYSSLGQPQCPLRIILPSEYARMDIATGPVFDAMCSTTFDALERKGVHECHTPCVSASDCVDVWPIVAARNWFYGAPRSINVDKCSIVSANTSFAERGDVVRVSLLGFAPVRDSIAVSFNNTDSNVEHTELQGTIQHIWTVHHRKRASTDGYIILEEQELSERDQTIIQMFNFVEYTSPSDSVNIEVPELPVEEYIDPNEGIDDERVQRKASMTFEMTEAIKKRREALKERRRQMKSAWDGWEKPILKPGDILAMLRPSCPEDFSHVSEQTFSCAIPMLTQFSTDRILLIHRFWTESDERSRHILYIPGENILNNQGSSLRLCCSPPLSQSLQLYANVRAVSLCAMHPGKRGPERHSPVSSIGTLDNGEKYFIYRFLLYWDGFEVSRGKSASAEGVYLTCLNLPAQARASSSAVRIVSVTPPGVKSDVVLERLKDDIIRGMTDGFVDIDANGEKRRIFLDLVGFIGDTPALNAALDVLGHNSTSCCHLCRYSRRSSTLVGSRYTACTSHGNVSGLARGYHQHRAVRDCSPGPEPCRLLGMKHEETYSNSVIHNLRQEMMVEKKSVPTSGSIPVVPGDLDPYRASLIAPDHLLTGHLRDCINLAFRLLPSKKHRASCECFMAGYLSSCGLPTQNRLYDHEKKYLFSMSMSEIYALGLVAEFGFVAGCAELQRLHPSLPSISEKCKSAIALVGSCSALISSLWYLPDLKRDGEASVKKFDELQGQASIFRIQREAFNHIEKVRLLCTMDDDDVILLDETRLEKSLKAKLSKTLSECLTAIKIVDKPNLHRLLELVTTTLPMVGHVARIGELSLEKAHQSLKRGIILSNNREIQLLSMNSIVFNDWIARLTLLAPLAIMRDSRAVRGFYRLLAGREAVAVIQGKLTADHEAQVYRALGPRDCVPEELRLQEKTVISPRYSSFRNISWKLEKALEIASCVTSISTEARRCAFRIVRNEFPFYNEIRCIQFGDSISSTIQIGIPWQSFAQGDVLETLCWNPSVLRIHFPFVMQTCFIDDLVHSPLQSGSSLWCVSTFLAVFRPSGDIEHYACVAPCHEILYEGSETRRSKTYQVPPGILPSFLRMHENVRKVGVVHACATSNCKSEFKRRSISHGDNTSPLEGGTFYALGKKMVILHVRVSFALRGRHLERERPRRQGSQKHNY